MKVVINRCWGGFCLSKEAYEYLGLEWDGHGYRYDEDRANIDLVHCIEELGRKADGRFAELEVVKIPDDVEWHIEEYDGLEAISEDHRVWY